MVGSVEYYVDFCLDWRGVPVREVGGGVNGGKRVEWKPSDDTAVLYPTLPICNQTQKNEYVCMYAINIFQFLRTFCLVFVYTMGAKKLEIHTRVYEDGFYCYIDQQKLLIVRMWQLFCL